MSTELPEYFFRIRDNGAAVFRVDTQNRQQRIDMKQIAVVNVRNGEVRPQGDTDLSEADLASIHAWMEARQKVLSTREAELAQETVELLNKAAQWAQSKASAEDLERVSDTLLLAMHDLRSVLVRKKSERLG